MGFCVGDTRVSLRAITIAAVPLLMAMFPLIMPPPPPQRVGEYR